MKTIEEYLRLVSEPRQTKILGLHEECLAAIDSAKGSSQNHQAWRGGYRDHLTQCLIVAEWAYKCVAAYHGPPPFRFESAVVAIYFHDWEKLWKYADPPHPQPPDKMEFVRQVLPARGIVLTDEELNAVEYAHGEPDHEYRKDRKAMGRLAALVHAAVDCCTT